MKILRANGAGILVYEPTLKEDFFFEDHVVYNFGEFKDRCDVIVANRWIDQLYGLEDKVYTSDLYKSD